MNNHINRRNFIRTSAACTLAPAALPIPEITKADENAINKPPLKIGLMTYNLGRQWDIETIIKNCTEAKWVHAELRTTHKHGVEVTLDKQQRSEVKKRFADSPLEAISLASAFKYHSSDPAELKMNISGTKEYLQLATDVGAIGIRVFPNAFPENISKEKTMEQIGQALAEVGEFGYNLGVDVRVCVHGKGTNYVPYISRMIDYSGSSHVYVNWNCDQKDLEGEGFDYNFNLVKDRIRGVHLKNLYNEAYPYRKFFELLRNADYQGYCNCEVNNESPEPIRFMKYYRGLFLAYQNVI